MRLIDLSLNVSGSGKLLTYDLNVDNLDCGISGSGDIILGSGGSIDNGDISISGSGGFSGEGIEIDHLEVSISGSGNCRCRAGDSLDAHVSGSGNVTYIRKSKGKRKSIRIRPCKIKITKLLSYNFDHAIILNLND